MVSLSSTFKGLFVQLLLLSASAAVCEAKADPKALSACLTAAKVENEISTSANYTVDTTPWQVRLQPNISAIAVAFPLNTAQVQATVKCAEAASVSVSALAGGHSFAAFGYGFGATDVLIVNLQHFTALSFDSKTNLLTVGSGNRVGPALKFLWDGYGRHFPHVRHGHVGFAGSVHGGGWGTTSRQFGPAVENVVGAEFVLANGSVVQAGQGSDLLWAARGAASSFGIMTSVTTKTFKPEFPNVLNFTVTLGNLTIDAAADALLAVQKFGQSAPVELSLRFTLASPYSFFGYWYGAPEVFNATMKPLMDSLPAQASLAANEFDFWTQENFIAPGANLPGGGSSPPRSFYNQALILTNKHPLTHDLAKILLQRVIFDFNRTDVKNSGFLDLWGGISNSVKDSDASYTYGNNLWLIRMDTNFSKYPLPFPADAAAYGKSIMKTFENALVAAGIPLRGFANYRDTLLTEPEWSSRLYGSNYAKLKKLKAIYDPKNRFTSNLQAIKA